MGRVSATQAPVIFAAPLKAKRIEMPEIDTAPSDHFDETFYHDMVSHLEDSWWRTARAYEANPASFANAWCYLSYHPMFWRLHPRPGSDEQGLPVHHMRNLETGEAFNDGSIWMHVARVNPATCAISDDPHQNTRTEVWLEAGEWSWVTREKHHITHETHYHNPDVDCGGLTYEEAIVQLAYKVWQRYGNDRRKCAPEYHEQRRAKQDKQLAKRNFAGRMVDWEPYGHMCRHQPRSGLAAAIEQSDYEAFKRSRKTQADDGGGQGQ